MQPPDRQPTDMAEEESPQHTVSFDYNARPQFRAFHARSGIDGGSRDSGVRGPDVWIANRCGKSDGAYSNRGEQLIAA